MVFNLKRLNLFFFYIMLEKLCQNNELWLNYAMKICKNYDEANDLVQEMYLRFHRNKYRDVNKSYVYQVLVSIHLNSKVKKEIKKESFVDNKFEISNLIIEFEEINILSLNDKKDIFIENVYLEFHKIDQIIIKYSLELGQTKFSKMSNISLVTIKKINKKFKDRLCQLKKEYQELEMS